MVVENNGKFKAVKIQRVVDQSAKAKNHVQWKITRRLRRLYSQILK